MLGEDLADLRTGSKHKIDDSLHVQQDRLEQRWAGRAGNRKHHRPMTTNADLIADSTTDITQQEESVSGKTEE